MKSGLETLAEGNVYRAGLLVGCRLCARLGRGLLLQVLSACWECGEGRVLILATLDMSPCLLGVWSSWDPYTGYLGEDKSPCLLGVWGQVYSSFDTGSVCFIALCVGST